MNYSAIPKSIAKFQTGNNKPLDIYVWAYIKLCSDYKTNVSHITEEKLSALTKIPERTIRRSIKRLRDAGCLEVGTTITGGCKKRNSYRFKGDRTNVFLIDNGFFHIGHEAKIGGFMLLVRAVCLNNTDKVLWSKTKIAEEVGMSRNTVSVLINECERSGLIKAIPNGYEITEKSLSHTAVGNKVDSPIYKAICGFCGMKGANPPVWDKDAMSVILTRYNSVDLPPDHEMNIGFQLNRRCGRLPQKVTLAYFIKVLGMETQYRAVILAKSAKSRLEYAF